MTPTPTPTPTPTYTVHLIAERHRAGYETLIETRLPGAWRADDFDALLAAEADGQSVSLIAEDRHGHVDGFMCLEMRNEAGQYVNGTVRLSQFVSINQSGLAMLEDLPSRMTELGFSQITTDTDNAMMPALESLGWTVCLEGFGLAWIGRDEFAVGDTTFGVTLTEPREHESRPHAAYLPLDDSLYVWPYRYAADPDNDESRYTRISRWLTLSTAVAGASIAR
jgi:hypothetical protein